MIQMKKEEKWRKVEEVTREYPEILLKAINDSEELKKLFIKTINNSGELKEELYDILFFSSNIELKKEVGKKDVDILITEYLNKLGMPRKLLGYKYVREAIKLCIESPERMDWITKRLYPTIAKKYNSTPSRVERSIRHSIEVVWSRGDNDSIQEIFGYTVKESKGRATNSEFIALLADEIGRKLKY